MFSIQANSKANILRAALVAAIVSVTALKGNSQGFIKAEGTSIVNEKGEKVILRGMGLGGWMLQEGYMFHVSNLGQQYKIKQKIADVIGDNKTKQFYNDWLTNHTTKKDVDSMASWGFNSIRLPMHYNLYTLPVDQEPVAGENTWIEKGFAITDSLLKWCKQNKMYLILDLHAAPGGQGTDLAISDRDPSKPSLWESEANQNKMIALWHKLAARYANEPNIGGYDIINEPNWGFQDTAKDKHGTAEQKNEPLRNLMIAITKSIRSVDTKHIIIIEGNGFGNNYNGVLPAWDSNMVVSFHKYGNFNNVKAINHFLELRAKYNIPLWMGESGENSNTWFTEAISLAESNNIGWAWWQSKKMGINNPLEVKEPAGYDKLLKYWSGKGDKPSEQEATATLNELLNNIKIENNIYHRDVIDAMFRQVKSNDTKPFKQLKVAGSSVINAVDFDMGKQGFAYYDKDTASYHYTPGVNTQGNRGYTYRNDGVDISGTGAEGYYVFNIEDGEWLQYTIDVEKAGNYTIVFKTASDKDGGKISFSANSEKLINALDVPNTKDLKNWNEIKVKDIQLKKGINKFRVLADVGGFNFSSIQFVKQN
ncbi:cellulase family glycosylhydrolase [Chitinophagaceae bacterium LWZ2-11]